MKQLILALERISKSSEELLELSQEALDKKDFELAKKIHSIVAENLLTSSNIINDTVNSSTDSDTDESEELKLYKVKYWRSSYELPCKIIHKNSNSYIYAYNGKDAKDILTSSADDEIEVYECEKIRIERGELPKLM